MPAPHTRSARADLTITESGSRLTANSYVDGFSYQITDDRNIHVSWSDLFDFTVDASGSHITVHAGARWHHEPVYTYLIGQVLSVALLQKRIESLHASAVAVDGKAIVLVGNCGSGKSTLTAALIGAGASLITDDLLVLDRTVNDRLTALSGARRLKLHPDTAARVGLTFDSIAMDDGSGKRVYDIPSERFTSTPTPVHSVIVLRPHARDVSLTRMDNIRAVREVIAATFNPLQNDARRLKLLLDNARAVVGAVPFYELAFPHDFENVGNLIRGLATDSPSVPSR